MKRPPYPQTFLLISLASVFANCSKVGYEAAKFQTISSTGVFGDRPSTGTEPNDGRGGGTEGNGPSPTPTPTNPTPSPSNPNPNPNPNPYPNPTTPTWPTPTTPTPPPAPITPSTPTSPTSPSAPTPNPIPNPTPPAPTPAPGPTPAPSPVAVPASHLPVDLVCSVDMTRDAGYNLLTADSSTMVYSFFNAAGARVCDFSVPGAREDILNSSYLTMPQLLDNCPGLVSGGYTLQMHVNALAPSILMSIQPFNQTRWTGYPVQVAVTVGGDRSVQLASPDMPLVDPVTGDRLAPSALGTRSAKVVVSSNLYDHCTYTASPLVIQLEEPGRIVLTPPLGGHPYDILGANARPPHAPMQISWFTPASAVKNYMLVLPDERGEVNGIDQLFGDNTTGPDGRTPAKDEDEKLRNGYEALRKWDGRREDGSYIDKVRDGFITPDDPVFDRLRLWLDANHDAVAQPAELTTLAAHQVIAIDLDYVRDFVETDGYGNQTRMKSVTKTADGKLHLMYDLWFRALDPSMVPGALVARTTVPPRDEVRDPVRDIVRTTASAPAEVAPTTSRATALSLTAVALVILAFALVFVP